MRDAPACLSVSPSPVAATSAVRPRCGLPLLRGRGRLETALTPYGSRRFLDRVPEPSPRRLIGSSRGKLPSRWWSRSDGPACRSQFPCVDRIPVDPAQETIAGARQPWDASRKTARNCPSLDSGGACATAATGGNGALRPAPPPGAAWRARRPRPQSCRRRRRSRWDRVPCQDRLGSGGGHDGSETAVSRSRIHRRAALPKQMPAHRRRQRTQAASSPML